MYQNKILVLPPVLLNFFLGIIFLVITFSCAHIEAPTGGPKDLKPPVVLECDPPNSSPNFKADKIKITFNKFINLNNINQQVIVSPTFKKFPEFVLKNKTLMIKLKDSLKENTTYNIFMGEAIADVNENNILKNYQYVFSTGTYVDSLAVKGKILDAFTLKPDKDIFVLLYDNPVDSLPFKVKPSYITKSDVQGNFALHNLKGGQFKIFALKDANNNYIYDLSNELIAFDDSLVTSEIDYIIPQIDTSKTDTSKISKFKIDSLKKIQDSIQLKMPKNTIHQLYFFKEKDTIQKLINARVTERKCITFIFKIPTKNVKITPLNHHFETTWSFKDPNQTGDTIKYWLPNVDLDSLTLKVMDDTLVLDTVKLNLKVKETTKKKSEKPINIKFSFLTNIKNNDLLGYSKSFVLTSSRPVTEHDFSKIILKEKKDSTIIKTFNPAVTITDSSNKIFEIKYKWDEFNSYNLFIPPGTFKDILGAQNDTIKLKFKIKPPESYGNIKLKIDIGDHQCDYVLQLMDEKENVLRTLILPKNKIAEIKDVDPGNYKMKLIYDSNRNGKWDTGNYRKKQQPEKVKYYPEPLTIRANWDMELDWKAE